MPRNRLATKMLGREMILIITDADIEEIVL